MRTCTVLVLVFSLAIGSLTKALCQTPADKEQDIEKIVVGTNEVVLDAVVKDKKGRAVKDLTAADFQISEDIIVMPDHRMGVGILQLDHVQRSRWHVL